MGIVNYVRNGRRFGDRKMLTGAKIRKMSLQAYDNSLHLSCFETESQNISGPRF